MSVLSPSASEYYAALSRDLAEPITTKFALPDGFRIASWRPSLLRHVPGAGLSRWKFGLLSAVFTLLPGGSRYRVYVIFAPDGSVAHYSVLHPKYFRFPFMGQDDLQIGGFWTEPRFRGMGLATFAVEAILRSEERKTVTYWYVARRTISPRSAWPGRMASWSTALLSSSGALATCWRVCGDRPGEVGSLRSSVPEMAVTGGEKWQC